MNYSKNERVYHRCNSTDSESDGFTFASNIYRYKRNLCEVRCRCMSSPIEHTTAFYNAIAGVHTYITLAIIHEYLQVRLIVDIYQ